ncbi:hypothetical protein [Deinococcus aluminii]|uniref:Uncharacterized protein n=1 Tax=Deinococcus aluminii TaxID=1656885 RepID=A0ABP9XFY3_9DEIO
MPCLTSHRAAAGGLLLELATTDLSLHAGRTILTLSWPGHAGRNLFALGAAYDPFTASLLLGLGPAVCWLASGHQPRWTAA